MELGYAYHWNGQHQEAVDVMEPLWVDPVITGSPSGSRLHMSSLAGGDASGHV